MNRRAFLKAISCIPMVPFLSGLVHAGEKPRQPVVKSYKKEAPENSSPLVRFRRYESFQTNTEPLCEGITPTSRALRSTEYYFATSEELNRNWKRRLEKYKGV